MKNLDLNQLGVQEMTNEEIIGLNGGRWDWLYELFTGRSLMGDLAGAHQMVIQEGGMTCSLMAFK